MFCSILLVSLRSLLSLVFRVKHSGIPTQDLPKKLLIIANHESFLDGVLLGAFLPNNPVFVVHTGVVQNPWFRIILSLVDYLAVDPMSPMAMKKVIKLIESGRPVVIFPEGRITVTGSLMKVYDGPAFVAAKTGATLLPIRLDGPSRSYFSRLKGQVPRKLFPAMTITALPYETLPMPEAPMAKQRRRLAGAAMQRIMQKMIFESQPKQTLYAGLLEARTQYGPARRVIEDIRQIEYSYNDILKMTIALGLLCSKITQPKECVGLLLPNMASTLGALIGLGARNRVPAMLNYKAGSSGIMDACIAAKISTIFTSRAFIEQAKLESDVGGLTGIKIYYLEDLKEKMTWTDKLATLWFMKAPMSFAQQSSPEDIAVVLFTSGSEGKPKGVVLSHRALLSNIAQIRSIIDFSTDDKVLNALPIFHSFGLTGGALLPLLTGMQLFLYPNPLHYRVIPELAYGKQCSVLFGTSTFLGNYAKHAHDYDFFRMRYVIAGAEKLNDTVRQTWVDKFGIRIFEGYGATETAPVLAVNTSMAYKKGTVGQLLPSIQYHLESVPGVDRGGLLYVKGPNLMSGYYRYEAPGQLAFPPSDIAHLGEGWYNTGDIVDVDDQKFVTILGRVKRFAKVAGEMVSLEVVEKMALHVSPDGFHGATTKPDGDRGEKIVLFTTDPLLKREALSLAAQSLKLPEIAVPRVIVEVSALPLLGTGKTDYVTLKRQAETV